MLIAIDVDGVKVNYRQAYANRWGRVFGTVPAVKDAAAYKLWDHLDIDFLEGDRLEEWNKSSDSEFWSTMPLLSGALEACHRLVEAGHELISVTAAPNEYHSERSHNLRDFPLTSVYCVGSLIERDHQVVSPKAALLNELKPHFFIDDYINYFAGVDPRIQRILINKPVNTVTGLVRMNEIDHVVDDLQGAADVILAQAPWVF